MPFTERSRRTREAILDAARRRFTEEGYQQTTIRSVAADAGVDPSMVMRYYGSKDGLFSAAVAVDLGLPDLTSVPPDQRGALLARHLVTIWESEWGDRTLLILLRSAVSHPEAAERLREVFAGQVAPLARRLSDGAPDADVRAGLISTLVLGTALCRYILRLPPVAAMDADALVGVLAPLIQHVLTGPVIDGRP